MGAVLRTAVMAAAAGVVLTSCQTSPRIQIDAVTHAGVVRCANGQSYIMEYGVDDDPTAFGAASEARKDLYCTNEDGGPLWWDRLDVRVAKYVGNWKCDESAIYYTTINRSVSVHRSKTCAPGIAGNVSAMGIHGATRPGEPVPRRELSFTPDVITQ